jgi:glyoxylase-like metal-dependent hydrolase (beta-lactamase superfamily II)
LSWDDPGVEDLGGGIHRIPLRLPMAGLKAVNVYALADSDGVDLVDAGMAIAGAREQLLTALGTLGAGLGDIRNFLITHVHRDHYTLAVELRRLRAPGAVVGPGPVYLGEGERDNLAASMRLGTEVGGDAFIKDLHEMGADEVLTRLATGDRGSRPPADEWEDPDRWVADGAELVLKSRTLRAIHTPGHTVGHLVFHDEASRTLFAGDHVLPRITPSIGFEPVRNPMALRDYLTSLRLMLELPDARLLPAHGPATDSVHARVDELLAHHEDRLTETLNAVRAGAGPTAYQVAQGIRWTRRRQAFDELEPVSQLLAVGETAAHLEVLVVRDELSKHTAPDGVIGYQTPALSGRAGRSLSKLHPCEGQFPKYPRLTQR